MTEPASSRRRGRPGNGRQRLLEVAGSLFGEKGFEAVSTKELAKSASLTIGTLYHHFESKEAVYQATLECALERLASAPLEDLSRMAPRQALERLVAWFSAALMREPMLRQELLSPHGDRELTAHTVFRRPLEKFYDLLPVGAPGVDPAMAIAVIVSLSFGLTSLNGLPARELLPTDSDELARMITGFSLGSGESAD